MTGIQPDRGHGQPERENESGRVVRLPDGEALTLDQPLIMGVLNVTPDSFSDGGCHFDPRTAVRRGLAMAGEGADIIDVGGESTRPGAQRVDRDEQIRRVVPVIQELRGQLDRVGSQVMISVDTTSATVAQATLVAGAAMINDVSAGRDDPDMLTLAAARSAPIVLMHMRGHPGNMQDDPRYENVVEEVWGFLRERAEAATAAGVGRERILIDPGIGFGKTTAHNLALLAGMAAFVETGYPVVLGTSRKRFMREVCQRPTHEPLTALDMDPATCCTTALGVAAGVAIFRVHDVAANRQAADLAWAIRHRHARRERVGKSTTG